MATIGTAIRAAAAARGQSLEAFRQTNKLPNSTFYWLLGGKLPAKVATREKWRKRLERAGVEVNGIL